MSKSSKLSLFGTAKIILIFTSLYAIVTVVLMLLASFVLINTMDPLAYTDYTSKGISLLSTFIAGLALSKKLGERYLLSGITLGIFISCLLLLLSLFVSNCAFNPIIYIATVIAASIGALLGKKREKHKRTKHKRK